MTHRKTVAVVLLAGLSALAGVPGLPADDAPKAAEPGTLTVVDGSGKEHKLKAWKFVTGTRRLTWLAPTPKEEPAPKEGAGKKGPAPARPARPEAGPEALEFRDENSTSFVEGVLTLIPLDRLRAIDYNAAEDAVTARVAGPKAEEDLVLTGTTKFQRINKLALEADVDRGE